MIIKKYTKAYGKSGVSDIMPRTKTRKPRRGKRETYRYPSSRHNLGHWEATLPLWAGAKTAKDGLEPR